MNYDIKTQITREIYDHEILIEFLNDRDAELFYEWWQTIGFKQFEKWAKKNEKLS